MKRYVINLPKLDDEDAASVQLIVGKTVSVDGQNRHFFGGKLEKETIKGLGLRPIRPAQAGPDGRHR